MKNFWCEVYKSKLFDNLKIIKDMAEGKKVIAVVKGNAYGLGIEKITSILSEKVDYFAVADIEEAYHANTDKSILILSPLVSKEDFNTTLKNIIFTIDNKDILKDIPCDLDIKIHIYVDTGMNRMGIKCEEVSDVMNDIKKNYSNVIVDGIYTHLHNIKDVKYTLNQIDRFYKSVEPFMDEVNMIHCLKSSGVLCDEIRNKCSFTNAVRVGNILYGYEGYNKGFRRIYNYYARPVNIYSVAKGRHVGYGCLYKAKKDIKIGILGLGVIDHFGFSKDIDKGLLYNVIRAAYNSIKFRPVIFDNTTGKGVKIVGKPNMNVTMIDMDGVSEGSLLRVEISPILADSRVPKRYC